MNKDVIAQLGVLAARRAIAMEKEAAGAMDVIKGGLGLARTAGKRMFGGGAPRVPIKPSPLPGSMASPAAAAPAGTAGAFGYNPAAVPKPSISAPAPAAAGTAGAFGYSPAAAARTAAGAPGAARAAGPGAAAPAGPASPMSLQRKLGLGVAGTAGATAAGTGGMYQASDTDHIGGLTDKASQLEKMKADYQKEIDDYGTSGGNSMFSGSSSADREAKLKQMKANMESGNYGGGGMFGGTTYAQLKQQAQTQADTLANGRQVSGGAPNRLFGYRDQGSVDTAMTRFDDPAMQERLKKLGINGPRGRTPASAAKPDNKLIGTGAVNWDNYNPAYHNAYKGTDWTHLLNTNPSYMNY